MRVCAVSSAGLNRAVRSFNQRSWLKQGMWPGSFLWFSAILESFSEQWTGRVLDRRLAIKDYACIGQVKEVFGAFDCLIGASCFEEIRIVMEEGYAKAGPAYLRHYASLCETKCNEWLRFARSVAARGTQLKGLSENEIADVVRQYFVHLRENGAFMDTIIVLADLLGDVVGKEVETVLKQSGIDDPEAYRLVLDVHSPPLRPTNVVLAERSLRQLAEHVCESSRLRDLFAMASSQAVAVSIESEDEGVHRLIQKHVRRFGWLSTYSFIGEPLTAEQVVRLVQERMEQGMGWEEKPKCGELEERVKAVSISAQLRELLDVTRTLAYVNATKDDVHQITWRDIQPLVQVIARHLSCATTDLLLYTPHELESSLRKRRPQVDRLASRGEGWALLKTQNSLYVIQGAADLSSFRSAIKSPVPSDIRKLVGTPIFPGIVCGKARLVLTAADCDKVKAGDILVATNTSPDFIPAMHRAAAFVTDTGNLICHAVIAAREFRRPCVISTQIATQVLHDGESVEVDGAAGTVTRLDVDRQS